MNGRKNANRVSFLKKTVNFFKSPFQKKRKEDEFIESDSEYSDSSEESSEYSSEEELEHFDEQKHKVAFTSSQARFVTPENRPTNLRYQLRQNPLPMLYELFSLFNLSVRQNKDQANNLDIFCFTICFIIFLSFFGYNSFKINYY